MNVYEQVVKAYKDSLNNRFFDAWGLVASPAVIDELRAECKRQIIVSNDAELGAVDKIFGLVLISHNLVEADKAYIVNEELGRTILGQIKIGRCYVK